MLIQKRPLRRISWGAVFAGVVTALVVQLLLSLLGLAIGFGSIDPYEQQNPFEGLGTGALIWWVVSMLAALFTGGLAAGRLSGIFTPFDRALHGFLAFSLYALISFYLITTAVGGIISGVGSLVGQTLSMAGKGIGAVAPVIGRTINEELKKQGITLDNIKNEAEQVLRETGKPELQPENLKERAQRTADTLKKVAGNTAQNPGNADSNAASLVDRLLSQGEDIVDEVDREAAVNVVMKRTGKSRQESQQIVDNWISTYNDAKQKLDTLKVKAEEQAKETGDAIASAASKASIFAFFGLLLGAAAAAGGASAGKPLIEEVEPVDEERRRV